MVVQSSYKAFGIIIGYMLSAMMIYVTRTGIHFIPEIFPFQLSIIGALGLLMGMCIALVSHHYKILDEHYKAVTIVLRYALAIAVLPYLYYVFHKGLPSIIVLAEAQNLEHTGPRVMLSQVTSVLGIAGASLMLIQRTYKVGAILLSCVLCSFVFLDYLLGSKFLPYDFTLMNGALGLLYMASYGMIWKEDNVTLFPTIAERISPHLLNSTHVLKGLFIIGLTVYSLQNHIITEEKVTPLTADVITGKWKKRHVSYFNIDLKHDGMQDFLDQITNIDSLEFMEGNKGMITIDNNRSLIEYKLSPTTNTLNIYSIIGSSEFKLDGVIELMDDGQMIFRQDDENISIIFGKDKE